jgi:hypothetical protein
MKKIFLTMGIVAIGLLAYAQNDPRCPEIRRNNGNARGCDAKITLDFGTCSATTWYVIAVLEDGSVIPGVTITQTPCDDGKVEVCVVGSNLPTVGHLSLAFSDEPNGTLVFVCEDVPSGGPLPVSLSAFNARRNNSTVNLNWKTEFEVNTREFVIQRKTGSDFQNLATIAATNSAAGNTYAYSDRNSSKGSSQYRLKIVNMDGTVAISDIRNVRGTSGNLDFIVFPNPSNGKVSINITEVDDAVEVEVVDNTGRVIQSKTVSNSSSVEFNGLPKGMHLVRITNKNTGETKTQKISVL